MPKPQFCCQGAEEVDTIEWDETEQRLVFAIYVARSGALTFHPMKACPLCGEKTEKRGD